MIYREEHVCVIVAFLWKNCIGAFYLVLYHYNLLSLSCVFYSFHNRFDGAVRYHVGTHVCRASIVSGAELYLWISLHWEDKGVIVEQSPSLLCYRSYSHISWHQLHWIKSCRHMELILHFSHTKNLIFLFIKAICKAQLFMHIFIFIFFPFSPPHNVSMDGSGAWRSPCTCLLEMTWKKDESINGKQQE